MGYRGLLFNSKETLMKTLLAFFALTLMLSAEAAVTKIECTFAEEVGPLAVMPKSVKAVLKAKEGEFAYSKGLAYGKLDFSFVVEYTDGDLNVVIQENNQAQSEVGNFGCTVARSGTFCEEPVNDFKGRHAFNFSCRSIR